MNRHLLGSMLLALAAPALQAQSPPADPPVPNTQVRFLKPEKFIDASDQGLGMGSSPRVLQEIQAFLEQLGRQYLPAGEQLSLDIRDIDLAGRFEPMPTRPSDWVRVQRDSDWPRIQLHYRLSVQGKLLREGDASIADMSYLQKARSRYSSQPLGYEKNMLNEWFKANFAERPAGTQ